MWFFTLALLIVAGYLLYDAVRDRNILQQPHELTTARQPDLVAIQQKSHQYINTSSPQATTDAAPAASDALASAHYPTQSGADSSVQSEQKQLLRADLKSGSLRARESVKEIWRDAKNKKQQQKSLQQERIAAGEETTYSLAEAKSGVARSAESVVEVMRQAKVHYGEIAAARKEARTDPRSTELSNGVSKFKTGVAEIFHDGSERVKKGVQRRMDDGGAELISKVGDQTAQFTQTTKGNLGSGTARFTGAIGESMRDAKVKREAQRTHKLTSGEQSSIGLTVSTGASRFRESLGESWQQGKKRRSISKEHQAAESSTQLGLQDTLKSGTVRFKQSVSESWSSSKAKRNQQHGFGKISETTTNTSSPQSAAAAGNERKSSSALHRSEDSSTQQNQTVSRETPEFETTATASERVNTATAVNSASQDNMRGEYSAPADNRSQQHERTNDEDVSGAKPAVDTTLSPSTTAGTTAVNSQPNGVRAKRKFSSKPQGKKDDLTKVKGIGPVIAKHLNKMGVYHFHQLAAFSQDDIDYVNAELDFPGRIERDNWIEQATELASKQSSKTTAN